jgi:hypothetical protein
LAARLDNPSISTAAFLALEAVASFNLIYPPSVITSAAEELSANLDRFFYPGISCRSFHFDCRLLYSKNLGKFETATFKAY